ncbi:MAG: HD domain-containing protein [Nitrospira sp.]|nr:HD domain-containing protein [Nitrospira sp.]
MVLGFFIVVGDHMRTDTLDHIEPAVLTIQGMLGKIDRLRLPAASRRDVVTILVRQMSQELDRALPWQAGHSTGTAAIADLIGQSLGLDASELHDLTLAAFLHDIGLLMLPAELRQGGKAQDPASYVAIQNHPRLGANLLEPFAFLRGASILIAHHHEWWDGSGYPYGIRGAFIPLGARILAVADAFEAIQVPNTPDRGLRDHIALRILHVASGTQFDPTVVATLAAAMEESLTGGVEPENKG